MASPDSDSRESTTLLSSLLQKGQCTDDPSPQDVVARTNEDTTIVYPTVLTTILPRHLPPALAEKSQAYVEGDASPRPAPFLAPAGKGSREHGPVSYTHLRAHETRHDLVCR